MQFIEKQIFLKKGAKLPQELRIDGSPINGDWLAPSANADVVDQQVRDAGWHFFRLTAEVRGWALAMSKESACEAALRRALRRIGASRNGAEVVRVRHRSLFGMHFCQVRIGARHIQLGPILHLAPSVGLLSPAFTPERASGVPEFSEEAAA